VTSDALGRQLQLSEERRAKLVADLQAYFADQFDEALSAFRADELLTFMIGQIGPTLYNEGIADARAFLAGKLDDLDIEFKLPLAP
jgi:uncharacterized protein (DUF2164 family)